MNKLLSLLLVVTLGACTPIPMKLIDPGFSMKIYNIPKENIVTKKSIGDTLVDSRYRLVGTALSLDENIFKENADTFIDYYIDKGIRFKKSSINGDTCYGEYEGTMHDDVLDIKYYINRVYICIRNQPKANETNIYWVFDHVKNDTDASYRLINNVEAPVQETSFKQKFIYNGRVDNAVKFIYREFDEGVNRSTFQQDLQYDLSESNIIGFKELRLEVIEATNQNITYKVLNNFSMKDYE